MEELEDETFRAAVFFVQMTYKKKENSEVLQWMEVSYGPLRNCAGGPLSAEGKRAESGRWEHSYRGNYWDLCAAKCLN